VIGLLWFLIFSRRGHSFITQSNMSRPLLGYFLSPAPLALDQTTRLDELLFSHPLFTEHVFTASWLWPQPSSNPVANAIPLNSSCTSDPSDSGCRISETISLCLQGGFPWCFHATAGTWINPDNLLAYIRNLETFLNPTDHIIIKGGPSREPRPFPVLDIGDGRLFSRAAALFLSSFNYTRLVELSPNGREDEAFTIAAQLTLGSSAAWSDSRFGDWTSLIRADLASDFRDFAVVCGARPGLVFQVKNMIGIHTGGIMEVEQLFVKRALPLDLAVEWNGTAFALCRGADAQGDLDWLKRVTPVVEREKVKEVSDERIRQFVAGLVAPKARPRRIRVVRIVRRRGV
jgi:hypothetical protein